MRWVAWEQFGRRWTGVIDGGWGPSMGCPVQIKPTSGERQETWATRAKRGAFGGKVGNDVARAQANTQLPSRHTPATDPARQMVRLGNGVEARSRTRSRWPAAVRVHRRRQRAGGVNGVRSTWMAGWPTVARSPAVPGRSQRRSNRKGGPTVWTEGDPQRAADGRRRAEYERDRLTLGRWPANPDPRTAATRWWGCFERRRWVGKRGALNGVSYAVGI